MFFVRLILLIACVAIIAPSGSTIGVKAKPKIEVREEVDYLFLKCVQVVLKTEGGYCNNRWDPGGRTKYGISEKWHPKEDIVNLKLLRAVQIYYEDYWKPLRLHRVDDEELALHIFDMAINSSPRQAVLLVNRLVGCRRNGYLSDKAVKRLNNMDHAVREYKWMRKKYYDKLKKRRWWARRFYRGWINRIYYYTKFDENYCMDLKKLELALSGPDFGFDSLMVEELPKYPGIERGQGEAPNEPGERF